VAASNAQATVTKSSTN